MEINEIIKNIEQWTKELTDKAVSMSNRNDFLEQRVKTLGGANV